MPAPGLRSRAVSDLLDLFDEGVIVHSPDGAVLGCSAGAERILGLPANRAVGRRGLFSSLEAVCDDGVLLTPDREPAREALRTRHATSARRLRIRRPDGEAAWLQVRATLMSPPGGAVNGREGALTFVYDLGDQEALEQRLQDHYPGDTFSRLAGSVAHDFNHFLTAILGHAELLCDDLPAGGRLHEYAANVRDAAMGASGLARELLDFSRRQRQSDEVVDLARALCAMRPMLLRMVGRGIRLRVEPGPVVPPVRANAAQIERVILNLAANAKDAMRAGGDLWIGTRAIAIDDAFVREHPGAQSGEFARIVVRDTGAGMDAETRRRLFEPFFTTKDPGRGTGLGLATVYGIVKQYGGYIDVESVPGRGTEFRIDLPACNGHVAVAGVAGG